MRLQVHARLPDGFRNATPNDWSRVRRGRPDCDCFLEGPCFDRDGRLWCVDISNGRLLTLDPAGNWAVAFAYDGWPNGLKIGPDGTVLVADNRLGILRFDPASGARSVLADRFRGDPLIGPNDLTLSRGGDIYFTDQGNSDLVRPYGRVLCLRRDGRLDLIADGLPSPNGLVLSRDERLLYVAMTQANAIWRVVLGADGSPGKVGHFVQLSGSAGGGPDGLAIDAEDNLLVCHALAGHVLQFSRLGEPLARIATAEGLIPTNLAFGWPDPAMLVVTEAETATIQALRLDTPGWLTHLQGGGDDRA
ncbi:MAG: SMP-30/gluconolactonase/LRE family protein [Sneathiellaceae bacterium]